MSNEMVMNGGGDNIFIVSGRGVWKSFMGDFEGVLRLLLD